MNTFDNLTFQFQTVNVKSIKVGDVYKPKMFRKIFFTLFLLYCSSEASGNTLVLLDNLAIRETHSIFFKSLQGKQKLEPSCFL